MEKDKTPQRGRHLDIPIGLLDTNDGQIDGLPVNPRDITDKDFRALKKNLKDVPRMLDARALIVWPQGDRYVVIGGNQRLRALREEKGRDSVPCFVLPEDTTAEEMQAMTILDNTQRGTWNWDALANGWDAGLLNEWGVPAWGEVDATDIDGLFEDAKAGSADKGVKITIEVPAEFEDNIDDIRAAVKVTLEQWAGCRVQ